MAVIWRCFISTAILLGLCCCIIEGNLPEDLQPRRKTSQKDTQNYLVFRGTSQNFNTIGGLQEVQQVTMITQNEIVVTAKNKFYLIDIASLTTASSNNDIFSKQEIDWSPSNATILTCHLRGEQDCSNYIRVAWPISEHSVLLCGTNALSPQCRIYEWINGKFTENKLELKDPINSEISPKYKDSSFAYTYSDGNMYAQLSSRKHPVTRVAVSGENISWSDTSNGNITAPDTMPSLKSTSQDIKAFKKPRFAGSVDSGDKILFFFREIANEQFGSDDVEYARVGQVCKNDRGGTESLLRHKWTSYFKARLNCSVPGERPFYFNDIQHISKAVMVNGQIVVFATMTTPKNSIRGSAVCAFSIRSINKTFNGGFYKWNVQNGGNKCFSSNTQNAPFTHPSMCPTPDQDTRKLEESDLEFRRSHVLMKEVVQPITGRPLFMETSSRHVITAIAIDEDMTSSNNFTFMYLGTSDGRLLKVLTPFDQSESVVSEEVAAFNDKKCVFGSKKDREVIKVISVPNKNSILVVFKNCIISVPKHRCPDFSCKTQCVQSGNPYCGWHGNECVAIATVGMEDYEQDLFSKRNMTSCEGDKMPTSEPCINVSASFTSTIIPIIVCVCFAVLVVIVVVFYKLQKKPKFRNHKHTDMTPNNVCKPGIGSNYAVESSSAALIRNDSNSSRRIYTGPRNEIKRPSNASSVSRNGSFGRQAPSVPPPLPPSQSQGQNKNTLPKESSYESLKSVTSSNGRRGRRESRGSGSDSMRSFHGVNIVQNFKNIKTSPPPQRSNGQSSNSNNNNNPGTKVIGIATAMSRNESPVRRRCLSNQDEDFKDLQSSELKKNKSKSFRNPKINNYEVQQQRVSDSTQRRSLPSPQTIVPGANLKSTGPPMVTQYHVVSDARSLKSQTSEHDYANIVTPDNPPMKPPPPPVAAKPGRKLSSFTNSHFNTAWFPVTGTPDEQTSQGESGFGSSSSEGSSSETLHKSSMPDRAKSVDSAAHRFAQPPKNLSIKNRNIPEEKQDERKKSSPVNFYTEVVNPDDAIPIHYVDDSAFFEGKNDSSDDDIMRDLEEVMQRGGCKKQSTYKRKKTNKKKSPCENEVRFFNMIDRMNVSGLPYVLSDDEHIYEIPCNLEGSQLSSADDFNIGNSNNTQHPVNNFAFHTMRPPGRRRQKLPRLRNSEKEESKPLAVPTPVLPM